MNRAPDPAGLFSAFIVPSWLSKSCRTIASPRPVPFSLVVKKGSKITGNIESLIPGPLSSTVMTVFSLDSAISSSAEIVITPSLSPRAFLALLVRLITTCLI